MGPTGPYLGTATVTLSSPRKSTPFCDENGARLALVVPTEESAKTILDLPIAALRLPKTMVEELSILGFAHIGELAATPRARLALRFGPEFGLPSFGNCYKVYDSTLGDRAAVEG